MADLVITNLDYLVTVNDEDAVLRHVDVVIDDGIIANIVPAGTVSNLHRDDVLDGSNKLALPGLINLHTHLPMSLLRGLAEHVDLRGFLDTVWAAEAKVMNPDTVRLGAKLGTSESLRAGCTTQLDMYFHHREAHEGAVSLGARHVGGPVFFDTPGPDHLSWEQRLDSLRRWPQDLNDIGGPTVPLAVMPHAVYTCSPDHLRDILAVLTDLSPDHALMHIHLSETEAENTDVASEYLKTPTEVLESTGWFAHDIPVILAHAVHLSAHDRAAISASNVSVAHCPGSNMKLASGALPWQTYTADGVRLGLGTDGCASSNDLDMWQTMRQTGLLARLTSGDPETAPAESILRAATIDGARALGLGDHIGSLEVGKSADLTLIDLDQPHLTPIHDVAALLVFAAGRGDVTDVLVDGRIVVRDGHTTLIDEKQLLAHCRERAADIS